MKRMFQWLRMQWVIGAVRWFVAARVPYRMMLKAAALLDAAAAREDTPKFLQWKMRADAATTRKLCEAYKHDAEKVRNSPIVCAQCGWARESYDGNECERC